MTTKIKPLVLEIGQPIGFFSNDNQKEITGTIVKVNKKTVVLEVKIQRTVIEKIKSSVGDFFFKSKEKKTVVTETKRIKKRLYQLIA